MAHCNQLDTFHQNQFLIRNTISIKQKFSRGNFQFCQNSPIFCRKHWMMPIWLPAWKTLVNSTSSFSRNKPRDVFRQCSPVEWPQSVPRPPHGAVAAQGCSSPSGWLWDGTRETPKQTRELEQGAPHMRQHQFSWCTCPAAKEPSYSTSSQILRPPFIYLFITFHNLTQFKFSSDFCLFSKTFLIGNNFHFQARSRLEIQNYLNESDNENIMHMMFKQSNLIIIHMQWNFKQEIENHIFVCLVSLAKYLKDVYTPQICKLFKSTL